jgi:hypothetical protein
MSGAFDQFKRDVSQGGWWTFDSIDTNDISGRFNNGVPTAVTFTYGRTLPFGGTPLAAKFDGGTSKIDLPNIGLGLGNTPRTFCAWIYPLTFSGQVVFSYGVSTSNSQFSVLIGQEIAGDIYLALSSNDWSTSTSVMAANRWSHIAAVYDGGTTSTSTVHLYANGIPQTSLSNFGTPGAINTSDTNWGIGRQRLDNARYFNGNIDDARVFGRALSAQEIYSIYSEAFLSPAEYEMPILFVPPTLRQKHFRFRTDTGAANATPNWGAAEDTN